MAKSKPSPTKTTEPKPICGIVMPISERDGCSAHHWSEVLEILTDAAETAGYQGKIVSSAEHIGVIHQTIVDNLFDNPVVVCDVSTENPNVMFELGLRLAFDKPTVVVIDDRTRIQFDTSPIEHLKYPRDLRFGSVVEFKAKLADKLKSTADQHHNANCSTFLRSFKRYTPARLQSEEALPFDIIMSELRTIRQEVASAKAETVNQKQSEQNPRFDESLRGQVLRGLIGSTLTANLSTYGPDNTQLILDHAFQTLMKNPHLVKLIEDADQRADYLKNRITTEWLRMNGKL